MFQKLALAFFLFCFTANYGQNTVLLKGKIVDKNTSIPLESETIYLKSVKDSTVVDYTI